MRILITADPEVPVPPQLYGGIERVIDQLGQGYQARGHETILLANADSNSSNFERIHGWPGTQSKNRLDILRNMRQLNRVVRQEKPDAIHSFSRIAYLMGIVNFKGPIVQTYQREISNRTTSWARKILGDKLHLSACGKHMVRTLNNPREWTIIPNCSDTSKLELQKNSARTHLVFLGRIEPIKGIKEAIDFSLRSNIPLIIAGNIEAEWKCYFDQEIKSSIDGDHIQYIGPVNDEEKNKLLNRATAFLMLIRWEEPFGIVMAEALACGAPVIALNRGSVPEVVQHGVNGLRGDNLEELLEALPLLDSISADACREDALRRFSISAVSSQYLELLQQ